MVSKKISISLQEDLLKRVDEMSKYLNVARSKLIARILEERIGSLTFEKPSIPNCIVEVKC